MSCAAGTYSQLLRLACTGADAGTASGLQASALLWHPESALLAPHYVPLIIKGGITPLSILSH